MCEKGQEAHKETDGSATVRFWLSNCAVLLKNSDVLHEGAQRGGVHDGAGTVTPGAETVTPYRGKNNFSPCTSVM